MLPIYISEKHCLSLILRLSIGHKKIPIDCTIIQTQSDAGMQLQSWTLCHEIGVGEKTSLWCAVVARRCNDNEALSRALFLQFRKWYTHTISLKNQEQ